MTAPMSLWDKIQNAIAPVPTGMGGLLGEQDITNARNQGLLAAGAQMLQASGPSTQRTNFAQILGGGLQQGMGAYQGAIQGQIKNRTQALDVASQKAQMDAFKQKQDQLARISAARQATFQKYGPPPSGDPAAMGAWIDKVAPELLAAGDDIGQLVDYRKALQEKQNQNKHQGFQTSEGLYDYDPATGGFVKKMDVPMNPEELALKRAQIANTQANTSANRALAEQTNNRTQYNQFYSHNKDVADRASVINQALTTLRDSKGNPALYSSAVANFIQAADQKAQIRYQLLQYFKQNVDPSIAGKWEVLKSRMLQGTLPGYTTDAMIAHLEKLKTMSAGEWDHRRAGEIKRHPGLEGWIPPSDELFQNPLEQPQYDLSQYHFGGGQ